MARYWTVVKRGIQANRRRPTSHSTTNATAGSAPAPAGSTATRSTTAGSAADGSGPSDDERTGNHRQCRQHAFFNRQCCRSDRSSRSLNNQRPPKREAGQLRKNVGYEIGSLSASSESGEARIGCGRNQRAAFIEQAKRNEGIRISRVRNCETDSAIGRYIH